MWRTDYNANHPHSSLGNLTPEVRASTSSTQVTPGDCKECRPIHANTRLKYCRTHSWISLS
jgi:hypothetical protein